MPKYRLRSTPEQRKSVVKTAFATTITAFEVVNVARDFAAGSAQVKANARRAQVDAAFKFGHLLLGIRG